MGWGGAGVAQVICVYVWGMFGGVFPKNYILYGS